MLSEVQRRFSQCATAIGYLLEVSNASIATSIQDDIPKWYAQLGVDQASRNTAIHRILEATDDPWVRLYCAVHLREADPAVARTLFDALMAERGPVSSFAAMWRA